MAEVFGVRVGDRGRSVRRAVEAARYALEHAATVTLTDQERKYLLSALTKIITQLADVAPMDDTGERQR